jgi:hypothetical protein
MREMVARQCLLAVVVKIVFPVRRISVVHFYANASSQSANTLPSFPLFLIPDTDYCIDPSWEDATLPTEEETASPTEEEAAWPIDGGDTSSPTLSPTEEESAETAPPTEGA